jgi:hypothetical protein
MPLRIMPFVPNLPSITNDLPAFVTQVLCHLSRPIVNTEALAPAVRLFIVVVQGQILEASHTDVRYRTGVPDSNTFQSLIQKSNS